MFFTVGERTFLCLRCHRKAIFVEIKAEIYQKISIAYLLE